MCMRKTNKNGVKRKVEKVFLVKSLIFEKPFICDWYGYWNLMHEHFLHMNGVSAMFGLKVMQYYKITKCVDLMKLL